MKRRVEELLEHNDRKESRKFYKSIKDNVQTFRPKLTACKDEEGNLLTEKHKIVSRWKEYFKQQLYRDDTEPEVMEYFTAEPHIESPTYEEVDSFVK